MTRDRGLHADVRGQISAQMLHRNCSSTFVSLQGSFRTRLCRISVEKESQFAVNGNTQMRWLRKTKTTLRQGWLTISSPNNSCDVYSQGATLSSVAARHATDPMSGLRAPQSYNCLSRGCFSSSSEATEGILPVCS